MIADERKSSALPFVCFRCGECCARYQVLLDPDEARCIADNLGISPGIFIERYTDQRWKSAERFLVSQHNGACVFLQRTKNNNVTTCSIQRVKPVICRKWAAGIYRRECREGLARYWKITVGHTGLLEGSRERLRDFYAFIESLAAV